MLTLEKKIEELEPKIKTKFYNGRPTRKYKRLIELNRRCYGMDMDAMLEDMEKMLISWYTTLAYPIQTYTKNAFLFVANKGQFFQ